MRFGDRRDAGCQLAERLRALRPERPVIVALPRGGVPVAFEVARALGGPLDVMVVRKLGCPGNPELGIGAIAEDGSPILNRGALDALGIQARDLEDVIAKESRELGRRVERYRGDREALAVAERTVILIDDGVATGFTAIAAARLLRKRGARRVVLAAPVCSVSTAEAMRNEVDEIVCVQCPQTMFSIGQWYRDFSPTSDDEVTALLAEAVRLDQAKPREVEIRVGPVRLPGDLVAPSPGSGAVIFAHGSGSSRLSPRNVQVARTLNRVGLATLLLDLLTPSEATDRANVFDVRLLASRLVAATRWLRAQSDLSLLPVGYFGASTGAAAALWAAAKGGEAVGAVVSRGGRPDLAAPRLPGVRAPTLLIVGSNDPFVLDLNRAALSRLRCPCKLEVIPGATHLFEEPGALEAVADLACEWFTRHLTGDMRSAA